MALPDVSLSILDGALGTVVPVASNVQVKIGVCSSGVANTLYSFSDNVNLVNTLGTGSAVEAAAEVLMASQGSVYVMPVNASALGYTGTPSASLQSGSTATLAAAAVADKVVVVTITTGGTLGNMFFTVKVGTGATSQPIQSVSGTPWIYNVPGTLAQISFVAGTYILNATYTSSLTATTFTNVGGGPAATIAASPTDNYQLQVSYVLGGATGTAQFQYSLDNGNSFSPTITVPGGGLYNIAGAGMFLTFGGTAVKGDFFSWSTTTAGFSNTDLNNAFTALLALPQQFGMVHVVGVASSAANAVSSASTVETQLTTAQNQFRYVRGFVECPTVGTLITSGATAVVDSADTDSVVIAAVTGFSSPLGRTSICAGDMDLVSPLSGRIVRRNVGWAALARASAVPFSEDLGRVARGALPGVRKLYRDDYAQGGTFDGAGIITARTYAGLTGFYLNRGITCALVTSDYRKLANGRVMDAACTIARSAALKYLNSSVRVNKTSGTILEQDAKAIEADINSQLRAGIVNTTPQNASDSTVLIDRTVNILATSSLTINVRITPLGYVSSISVPIGFVNPALSAAAN